MGKTRKLCAAAIVVLTLLGTETYGVHLRGRILHVGFPASGDDLITDRGSDHFRVGAWTPIRVQLTNDDGDLFNGRLQAKQQDRDGDEIIASQPVPMLRDTDDYFLYVPASLYRSENQFSVRVFTEDDQLAPLFDDDGNPLTELPPLRQVAPIPAEARVILDISERPLQQLGRLISERLLARELIVARSSPASLPDNAAGFDMVDTIVWDGADPDKLRDIAQLRALVDWANRGGTLVLGVGRNWEQVTKCQLGDKRQLGDLLPARLAGVTSVPDTSTFPDELNDNLFDNPQADVDLDPPLTICPVTADTLAFGATPVIPTDPEPDDHILVSRRACGAGSIILVATEMRELLTHATQSGPFLRQVLTIRQLRTNPDNQQRFAYGDADLFANIERMIAFQLTAAWYFLVAFVFVIAYILVATIGSWAWLKRRKMTKHAWTTFAGLTAVACLASLASVKIVRGFGNKVQEFTVVDGHAGSFDVTAKCYFGLKTSSHIRLDLAVPADWADPDNSEPTAATLWPLAIDPENYDESVYSAAKPYLANSTLGQLTDVPLRATLKQFEAFWQGAMNGRLNASLRRATDGSGQLHADSWIENALGTDLDNCCLLVANDSFKENRDRPYRFKGIHFYDIQKLGAGQRISISSLLQRQPRPRDPTSEETETKIPFLETAQEAWLSDFARSTQGRYYEEEETFKIKAETFASGMMLLSTYDEIDPDKLFGRTRTIRRSQGHHLECSTALTKNTALFVGFSYDPGPARLCARKADTNRRFRPIEPSRARVMYRIAIPIGSP